MRAELDMLREAHAAALVEIATLKARHARFEAWLASTASAEGASDVQVKAVLEDVRRVMNGEAE